MTRRLRLAPALLVPLLGACALLDGALWQRLVTDEEVCAQIQRRSETCGEAPPDLDECLETVECLQRDRCRREWEAVVTCLFESSECSEAPPEGPAFCERALKELGECIGPDELLFCMGGDTPGCGDSVCAGGEDACTCPEDCSGPCSSPSCGDSVCEGPEDSCNCAVDCPGPCAPTGCVDEDDCLPDETCAEPDALCQSLPTLMDPLGVNCAQIPDEPRVCWPRCDPFTRTGCSSGQRCYVSEAGLGFCFEGVCSSDVDCGSSEFCVDAVNGDGSGLCALSCDPLACDATGCAPCDELSTLPSSNCTILTDSSLESRAGCFLAGAGAEGSSCTVPSDCARGLLCVDSECRPFCDASGGAGGCDTGACQPLGLQGSPNVGYCTP